MGSTTGGRTRLRTTVFALLLAAGLGGGAWWATHPDVFTDDGGFSMTTVQEEVGRSYYAGLFGGVHDDDRRELELRSATPVVTKNTADAEVELYLCEVDPEQGAVGVGTQHRVPTNVCVVFEPVAEGARFVVGDVEPRHELVVEVRATQPGVVKIRGMEVSYRDGLRRGTEVTGGHLTYRAR